MMKNLLKILLVLGLTGVFFYFFARSVDWNRVLANMGELNLPLFSLFVLLAVLHFFTRAIRWRYLLINEKKHIRFRNMVAGHILGYTTNYLFPGRIGELVKPLYLARKEDMRQGFVIGTIVVERLFDIFTLCALLAGFLIARPFFSRIFHVREEAARSLIFWGTTAIILATVLLLIILILFFFRERAIRTIGFLLRPLPERYSSRILMLAREFIDGLKFFHSLRNLMIYGLLSFAVWLGIVLFYWVLFFAFGVHLPYFPLIPYVFLTGIGASIPTPGMVGGFHYFSKLGMTLLLGIDPHMAVSITLIAHAIQVGVTCLLGYVIIGKEGLSLFQLKKMGESETR